jgi:hypothetical protein
VKRIGRALKARARWVGWPEDLTYYPIRNFENSKELLKDYFERHPKKEVPNWLSID